MRKTITIEAAKKARKEAVNPPTENA